MTQEAILITGAGKRIGRALALGLGGLGHKIAVHYRRSAREAEEVVKLINSKGGNAAALKASLENPDEAADLVDHAAKALSRPISVLINNAAAFVEDDLASFTPETFRQNFKTNLEAPMILAQAFCKQLPKNRKGNIINIIDQRVLSPTPGFLTYTVSKQGLYALTRLLAQELAPRIRVNGIGPGPTLRNVYQTDEDFAAEVKNLPLGRGPQLDEFVGAVDFILSTPSLTGQMIALDGGQHLR